MTVYDEDEGRSPSRLKRARMYWLMGGGVSTPPARSLFWVGGSGNWSDAAHWSLTTGGAGGQPAPDVSSTVTLDGSSGGGTVTVDGNISITALTTGAHTGTINATGRTITTGSWSGTGSATRTVNLTNATVNVTGNTGAVWNWATVTGLTLTGTGSTININGGNNGTRTVAFGAIATYGTVNITGSGAVNNSNNAATFVNYSHVGADTTTCSQQIAGFTISGTLTLRGFAQNKRLLVSSSATGTNRTVTAAVVVLENVDFANITAAGAAAPFTGTSLGNAGGNSNITFTDAVTRYLVAANGKSYTDLTAWSASSGGATGASMPLPQDTATADANSFSGAGQTFTVDIPRIGAQDWSDVTNDPTLAFAQAYFLYGSIDIPCRSFPATTGVLMTGGFTGTISNQTGTLDINLGLSANHLNSIGFPSSITMTAPGGTVRLLGHFQAAGQFTVNSGTFNANNFDLQYSSFLSTGTTARALQMGSGTWLSTSNGTLWSVTSTGMTLTRGTSTIKFFSASSPSRTFAGAGLTYYNFIDTWHDGLENNSPVIITGANTFNDLTIDSSAFARSVTFPAGATTTIEGAISMAGRAGAVLTVQSSTAASAATISDAAGTNVFDRCSIRDITASGGATFNATNSTNVSGNTGISFI